MMAGSFSEKVWEMCKMVPMGKVTTYKEIAHALGTRAYRAVGNALNKNPHAPIVPCHRVVKSDGALGGFAKGSRKKAELLEKEGVTIEAGRVADFKKILHSFK